MAQDDSPAATPAQTVGADIGPLGFQQNMWDIDILAGTVMDRDASPAVFTGGDTAQGLGGNAEPMAPGGTVYDRRGF